MKIGIIGAGGIAQVYGLLRRNAGHDIMISPRHPETLGETAATMGDGVRSFSIIEPAAFGDVVLLAVNLVSVESMLFEIERKVSGKVVIDATNPLVARENGPPERVISEDEIAGLLMQERLPDAIVVKSLTTMWTEYVKKEANRDAPATAIPFATDDEVARQFISTLILAARLVPIDLGGLTDSRPVDPPSPIWNQVLTPDELTMRVKAFRQQAAHS